MYTLKRATGTVCRSTSHLPIFSVPVSRGIHSLRPLPFDIEDGLGDFLSPEALKIVAVEYQEGLLQRLNEQVAGSEMENMSVAQTVISASNSIHNVLAFNYASQALNNSFFFDNLLPPGESPAPLGSDANTIPPSHEHTMSAHLCALIDASFGSLTQLKSTMSAAALGMMSSGWIWLVCDENASHLAFVATYGPGTMLVRSRQHRHPEGLSPNFGIGPGGGIGGAAGRMFKVLGERMDEPQMAQKKAGDGVVRTGGIEPLIRKPLRPPSGVVGSRTFHHSTQALSPLMATALQSSNATQSRFSQLPLAWRTPLEPLSTANRRPGVPHALQYSSASNPGEEDQADGLLLSTEPIEETPEEAPIQGHRPLFDPTLIGNTMHNRSNPVWDANRWRGSGDDLSPLMCISVHEHMWMAGGYGIWGKEEYLRHLWSVVNWGKVSRVLDLWTPTARVGLSSLSRTKGTSP